MSWRLRRFQMWLPLDSIQGPYLCRWYVLRSCSHGYLCLSSIWKTEQMLTFSNFLYSTEIGVNMRPESIIKYDFMGSWRSTIAENIRVGFTTTNPKGFLLGFSSNISGEYLTIMVSNSGKFSCSVQQEVLSLKCCFIMSSLFVGEIACTLNCTELACLGHTLFTTV